MAKQSFILFADDSSWRLCVASAGEAGFVQTPIPASAAPAQDAEAMADALHQAGYAGAGVMLAIPSSWCFSASISIADLPGLDRQAMLYRLEEKLPLPAESLVADFIVSQSSLPQSAPDTRVADAPPPVPSPLGTGERENARSIAHHPASRECALGICARIDVLRPLINALEDAGIAVQSISPAAILAAAHVASEVNERDFTLLAGEAGAADVQINIMAFREGQLVHWALLPSNARAISLHLQLLTSDSDSAEHLLAMDVNPGLARAISESCSLPVKPIDGTTSAAAGLAAAEILSGRGQSWIEFRHGPLAIADSLRLHRRPLNALLAGVAALLVIGAAVLFVRAQQYDRVRRNCDRQMAASFQQQFPGWPTPINIRVVVESEHRKAAAENGGPLPAAAKTSALLTLRDVIGHLPTDGRFTIDRMTLADASCDLEGRLRSFEDADVIASAARQAGMEVAPPQTRKLADGSWSFVVHGVYPTKPLAAVAKGAER